ncbi:predicted protein [Histoplasma capsulatum H143]|uniref:Uncharacterized protein n=1 Tax=Ajellomyces capsulatus (strain H143) TaxID=544712 RepID=C6HMF6_AJECH|nr:predicted protein [Histoplasma capsulatum H143]
MSPNLMVEHVLQSATHDTRRMVDQQWNHRKLTLHSSGMIFLLRPGPFDADHCRYFRPSSLETRAVSAGRSRSKKLEKALVFGMRLSSGILPAVEAGFLVKDCGGAPSGKHLISYRY